MAKDENRQFPPKIAKFASKSKSGITKIIDVTDALGFWNKEAEDRRFRLKDNLLLEGKIALNYTSSGDGESVRCTHFIDVGTARALFDDVVNYRFRVKKDKDGKPVLDSKGRPVYMPLVEEFKGGKGSSYGRKDWELCSSKLTITPAQAMADPTNSFVLIFKFEQCEGVKGDNNQVTSKRGSDKVMESMIIPLDELRPKAATALDYIRARSTQLLYKPFDVVSHGSNYTDGNATSCPE